MTIFFLETQLNSVEMSPCKVNMNASRIIVSVFLYGFSLLVILYFFCVGNNFFTNLFFSNLTKLIVRPWMVVRVIRTYAVFELSSDMVPFLRRVMDDSCVRHE